MLRTIFLTMLLIGLLVLIVSCGNKSNADEANAAYTNVETVKDSVKTAYACPMKAHQHMTSETPGKCAECGMQMVAVNAAATDSTATAAGCPMMQAKGSAGCANCAMHAKQK